MRDNRALAYSLRQVEDGWRWSVYDEEGITVADGAHPSQADAQAAVEVLLRGEGSEMGAARLN